MTTHSEPEGPVVRTVIRDRGGQRLGLILDDGDLTIECRVWLGGPSFTLTLDHRVLGGIIKWVAANDLDIRYRLEMLFDQLGPLPSDADEG